MQVFFFFECWTQRSKWSGMFVELQHCVGEAWQYGNLILRRDLMKLRGHRGPPTGDTVNVEPCPGWSFPGASSGALQQCMKRRGVCVGEDNSRDMEESTMSLERCLLRLSSSLSLSSKVRLQGQECESSRMCLSVYCWNVCLFLFFHS